MIKFSIIMVCLNPGAELARTVDSVLCQTYGDYEIVIKDGGSTDGAVDGIEPSPLIKVIKQKDSSIYEAMNQAVDHAEGDYCIFLNCGDYLFDATVLERAAAAMEKDGFSSGIYYGDIFDRLRNTHISSPPEITPFVCFRNVPCHQACIYSLDLMRRRRYDTRYRVRADYDHFLACYFLDGCRPVDMGITVASYEGGGYSESEKGAALSAGEREDILPMYMSAGQIRKFRLYMALSLQPLRAAISSNPRLAAGYQRIKSLIYKKGSR